MKYFRLLIIPICFTLSFSCNKNSEKTEVHSRIVRLESFKNNKVNPRNIDVWLPPSYTDSRNEKYPVLYMHDGQMLFDPKDCWNGEAWEIDSIADRLISQKLITPIIIVGIWSTEKRYQEYCPQDPITKNKLTKEQHLDIIKGEPLSNKYLEFIVDDLKPYIDQHFRTKTGKEHTAIMCSSMGGLISLYALCKYPDVFSKAGCMSTHWPGPNLDRADITSETFISYFSDHLPLSNSGTKIYFDYGTETLDSLYPPYQLLMDQEMASLNFERNKNWKTNRYKGHSHSEIFWRKRVTDPLVFLFGS